MIVTFPPPVVCSYDSGVSQLEGTTVIAGASDTPAPGQRVQLLRTIMDTTAVGRTRSDEAAQWLVEGIRARRQGEGCTVIAYDHTGVHDPVAKADLIPSPMPPDPAEHQ